MDGVECFYASWTAFGIPDLSKFASRVTVIVGIPMIRKAIRAEKKSELDTTATLGVNVQVVYLQLGHGSTTSFIDEKVTSQTMNPTK